MGLNKMRRQYAKGQMQRLAGGGSMVDDTEMRQFQQQGQQAANAALGAQQNELNRASMANTAGSPVLAGALKDSAQQIGEASANAAIQVSGQAQQFKDAVTDQRRNAALGVVNTQVQHDMQMRQNAVNNVNDITKTVSTGLGLGGFA